MTASALRDDSGWPGSRDFRWAGYLLGFSLGGFFDGILLHQILQWHHLLSGLEGDAFRDIRVQILADGLFHALMYLLAAVGLWLLWRGRRALGAAPAARLLAAHLLIGFGIWHVVDTVVSHWIMEIHRIRMSAENPLAWDVFWLVLFGLVPLVIGLTLRRGGPPGSRVRGTTAAALLAVSVVAGGAVAGLPPRDGTAVMVYFAPGTSAEEVFAAAVATDARTIWADPSGRLWVFDMAAPENAASLYRHGALFVGRSFLAAGCLAWLRAT